MGHKYVGLDVHQSSTVGAVQDEKGKKVMESIVRTEAEAIRDFLKGLRGTIHVTPVPTGFGRSGSFGPTVGLRW